ncbi:hypothetical protein NQ318_021334 [Aromia moschata]|uniref:Biogenesis of lysosome-related organelles complex 1 subunit 3 n=1 Tax=Aromia moschata TaxID=1265417 RepID=A0AAV8ZBQ6_9CUCU|nr:hypothetical protein NQ318_021334 [Aromia moschata]
MSKPVIISGEASETDSEDEFCLKTSNLMTQSVQGAVITGEDSESENENDASIASAISALHQSNVEEKRLDEKYDSLFHQKLREYNMRLHNNVESFCQNNINEAEKNLNGIDQHLLRSQLTLQGAATSLKSLSINSLTIKSKLHSLLSGKFLPNVKVNK